MEALPADGPPPIDVPPIAPGPLVVCQRQAAVGEYWDLPVEQAHAAFDRALAGFLDASGRAPLPGPARRPGEQAPAGRG